jgi:prepilin-type N-terminal cleavage/methylation domain-containing protein
MRKHKFQEKTSGFTLVELLVAVIIGLLSIYAVYTVYEQNIRANRSTSTVSNLQMSGVQAMFALRQVLTDAGSSFLQDDEFDALLNCPDPSGTPTPYNLEGSLYLDQADSGVSGQKTLSLRPLPVVLDEQPKASATGGAANADAGRYDQIFAFKGASSVYGLFPTSIISSQVFNVGSQNIDFSKLPFSLKERDVLVGIDDKSTPKTCAPYFVETVDTSTNNDVVVGQVVMTANKIVDLGNMSRYRFWVDTDKNNTLMMERYTLENSSTALVWSRIETPLISNVQDFVVQYGIDNPDRNSNAYDNVVDAWVDPTDDIWSEENLRVAGLSQGETLQKEAIQSIKAIRIGIVARTDQPDQFSYKENGCSSTNCTQSIVLFGTKDDTKMEMGDTRTTSTTGTVTVNCNLKYGDGSQKLAYRCRKYETIIPLRNAVWNWQ